MVSKNANRNKVIVIGGNHHNTLGLARSCGEQGLETFVYIINKSISDSFVLTSRYVSEGRIFLTVEECISYITEKFCRETYKPIVMTGHDGVASYIDAHYDVLKDIFLLFGCRRQGRVNMYLNKDNMRMLANASGFETPRTWHFNGMAPDDLIFPCIIKPISSIAGGKADMHYCISKNEVNVYLRNGVEYIAQEYIEKDFELNLTGLSIKQGATLVLPGVIRKIREYPVDRGSSSFSVIESCDLHPEINLDAVRRFMKDLCYEGLFSMEFLYKDGKCYFLEVNMRNDGNGYIPTEMGINLPFLWCKYIVNNEVPFIDTSSLPTPFYFMNEATDFYHVIEGRIGLCEWIRDLRRTDGFLLGRYHDATPYRIRMKAIAYCIVRDILGIIINKMKVSDKNAHDCGGGGNYLIYNVLCKATSPLYVPVIQCAA